MTLSKNRKLISFLLIDFAAAIILVILLFNYFQEQKRGAGSKTEISETTEPISWSFTEGVWTSKGDTIECGELNFELPVNSELVTSILYPGQYRGEDYKAHGGFRFDGSSSDDIEIRAPFDAYAFRGSRYLESGEVQYWIDFMDPCGRIYRFDHLKELSSELQELVSELPEVKENDSRSQNFNKPLLISEGHIISTAVGFQDNVFVDFGLYDIRERNDVSRSTGWIEKPNTDQETDPYGICWLDFINDDLAESLKSLPSGVEGNLSDYCD